MRVIVHPLLRVTENLIRLGDLLPAIWSFGIVREVLGTVLEREALVGSASC